MIMIGNDIYLFSEYFFIIIVSIYDKIHQFILDILQAKGLKSWMLIYLYDATPFFPAKSYSLWNSKLSSV